MVVCTTSNAFPTYSAKLTALSKASASHKIGLHLAKFTQLISFFNWHFSILASAIALLSQWTIGSPFTSFALSKTFNIVSSSDITPSFLYVINILKVGIPASAIFLISFIASSVDSTNFPCTLKSIADSCISSALANTCLYGESPFFILAKSINIVTPPKAPLILCS